MRTKPLIDGIYGNQHVYIRATNPHGFRSGQWAEVLSVVMAKSRPCYVVSFIDGALDMWPVYDENDEYEFTGTLPKVTDVTKPV